MTGYAARRRRHQLRYELFSSTADARAHRCSDRRTAQGSVVEGEICHNPVGRTPASRSRGSAPPPRRDPMRPIYIGVGVAFVAIVLAFAGFNWWQNAPSNKPTRRRRRAPTPAKSRLRCPTAKRSARNTSSRSIRYGAGRPRANGDGIGCGTWSSSRCTCTRTSRFFITQANQVPQFIGFAPSLAGSCLYWITPTMPGRDPYRGARPVASARRPVPRLACSSTSGAAAATRRRCGIERRRYRLRQRPEVRRRPDGDSIASASADRTRDWAPLVPPPNYTFPPVLSAEPI